MIKIFKVILKKKIYKKHNTSKIFLTLMKECVLCLLKK